MTKPSPNYLLQEGDKPLIGIQDVLAAATLTPHQQANERFNECQIRCQMLKGQLVAEQERLVELARQLEEETQRVLREVGS